MVEIGDSPGHAQHAIVSASREIHTAHGHFERAFPAVIERAERTQLRGRNLRIIEAAAPLRFSRLLHSFAYLSGAMAALVSCPKLLVRNGRHFNVHVNAIE